MPTPRLTSFALGDYQTNCFVVDVPDADPASRDCWIVDCGFEPGPLVDHVARHGLHPVAVLLTHAHADHIAGVDALLSRFGAMPILIHEAEGDFCGEPMLNLSAFLGRPVTCSAPTRLLADGETLELLGTRWRTMHLPGHSPGCCAFIHDDSHQAIVGDTLFAGSMGRVDFPTSDPAAMERSLARMMRELPDELVIHPGHGPSSTIGRERRTNPYLPER